MFHIFEISTWDSESASNSASDKTRFNTILPKKFFDGSEILTGTNLVVKNESRFPTEKLPLVFLLIM